MERGRIKDEIKGVLAILAGLIVTISLISHNTWDQSLSTQSSELNNLLGRFGSYLSDIMLQSAGISSYILTAILFIYGYKKIRGREIIHRLPVLIGAVTVLVISTSSLASLVLGDHAGGVVGIFATSLTLRAVSTTGSYMLFCTFTLITLMYLFQFSIVSISKLILEKISSGKKTLSDAKSKKKEKKGPTIMEDDFDEEVVPIQEPLPLSPPVIQSRPVLKKPVKRPKGIPGDFELPGIDLLENPPPSISKPTKDELIDRSDLLEKKLKDYSIEGKVTYVSPGPIVTMFEFEPAAGIKISKVMSLADDLAMALKAISIRISPIHGRSTLGIEVPNKIRDSVFLKDIVSNEAFHKSSSKLTLALGKDIFGIPVMTDLAKMPHLLIAGATGSGKSVGLNTIVLSILFKASPKEAKMLMIDPKMLELSAYEELPHLLMPVITLPKEASNALKKLVFEMERRYKLLAKSGARNIDAYNKKLVAEQKSGNKAYLDIEPLPYIVIFIDELADLMFASGREVEDSIARLAGMARAAGIHLVLATQRPSVDVITGIIKANFPSRISFQVSSKMDSRIILDTYGADQLLGKGDMLFTSPGKKIKRIHGAYVSGEEIRNVVDFIKAQAGPDYTLFEELVTEESLTAGRDEDRDEFYMQAREIVLSSNQASISYIQRRMKIGYNRAARIMEMLEDEGIVGPPGEAGKSREILRRI
ncbi:DNA translocase FtsK [bacterium BMS3Abin09]|nr:DNA translocase FtsK [bacterium BMS3Abin09]GBE40714.1 DNA translocase FtsK [bacterium BMS3Bbin09]HDO67339.1 DNA translocase FtsK [Nitrospirota bacterium]HEW81513.1 DNA translocase FtsK [Nitrospirota bacterium]